MQRVHFIGIGGTGISAIALYLLEKGWPVSGSDLNSSRYFTAVTSRGAVTRLGHHPDLALQADLVVRSSAVKDDDPEVQAARTAGIPVVKRADFLPVLTAGQRVLAVAGSHGKTTTTGMVITLLTALGQDPSYILGAEVKNLGCNAHAGRDDLLVIEADEYDYMFLGLTPEVSVITNIEHDHPDFFPTPEDYLSAFIRYSDQTQPFGSLIVCGDDAGVQQLIARKVRPDLKLSTYGFEPGNKFQAILPHWDGQVNHFTLNASRGSSGTETQGEYTVGLPGRHNILNACAALLAVQALGLNPQAAATALSHYGGTERRFEKVFDQHGTVIINDYAHHPTQISATTAAARDEFPGKTLWVIWEPHTFSRTERLQNAFVRSLDEADQVIITRIYAAREASDGYSPETIAALLPGKAVYIPEFDALADALLPRLHGQDVILVLSAGKGPQISDLLITRLSAGQGAGR